MRIFLPLALLVLLAGCQSKPAPAPAPPPVVVTAPAGPVVAPTVPADVLPERTEAALEARDRLLKGGQQHQVLMQSAFRHAPGFTVANWSGLVLSPKDLKQCIVVSSRYKVERVEIHPLTDGRLRVWVEVGNLGDSRIQAEGACEFRPVPEEKGVKFKLLPLLEKQGKIIVSFESERPQMEGYSILIRNRR
ncbi:MAG: hypothetical protein ABW223_08395 [Rariglobus sp.]